MMTSSVVLKVLAASVRLAEQSGSIIRDIFTSGELKVVEKVTSLYQTVLYHSH